jgi:hypothetical protein
MHDRGTGDPQDPLAALLHVPHELRHLLDLQGLGFLAGDVGGHELEHLLVIAFDGVERRDADPQTRHDDRHPGLDLAHRDRARPFTLYDDAAVHLGPVHRQPRAPDADLRVQVGRGIEPRWESSINVRWDQFGVLDGVGVGALLLEPVE